MNRALQFALAALFATAATPGAAYEAGDWILRVGATTVAPQASSDTIDLPTGVVADADVDNNTQLGIIPAYMVDEHWGIELLAATPFNHEIKANGRGAIAGATLDAGSTRHLPPTLMIQWYPLGHRDGWQPYIGFGANYTIFFDEDTDTELVGLLGSLTGGAVDDADLNLDNSFGLAGQVGVDIPLGDHWAVNLGVWYLDIDTTATITAKAAGQQAAKVRFDVDIEPWVYNVGIAYRF